MGYSNEFRFRDCPWCGLRDAQFNVLKPNLQADRPGGAPRTWTVMACPRCAGPVALETNPPNESPGSIINTIPDRDAVADVSHLPDDVKRHYEAARRVLAAGEADLAAVSLRRTLEAAAVQRGIDEHSLVKAVEQMLEQGLITTDFHKVLDHVRQLGNVGAHAGSQPIGADEVAIAMRFTTQVLRNLFEIPTILAEITASDAAAAEEHST